MPWIFEPRGAEIYRGGISVFVAREGLTLYIFGKTHVRLHALFVSHHTYGMMRTVSRVRTLGAQDDDVYSTLCCIPVGAFLSTAQRHSLCSASRWKAKMAPTPACQAVGWRKANSALRSRGELVYLVKASRSSRLMSRADSVFSCCNRTKVCVQVVYVRGPCDQSGCS